MADKNTSGEVIGTVARVQGESFILSSNGVKRLARQGSELKSGDTIVSVGSSAVVMKIDGAEALSIGHDQQLTLDQQLLDLIRGITSNDGLDEAVSFEMLAQAIEEGTSLEELLPSPAAGTEKTLTNLGSSGSSGAEGVRLERTAAEVTPESGFETSGLERIAIAPPVYSQPDSTNSRPTTTGIDNISVDQDQSISVDISQSFADSDENQTLTYEIAPGSSLPEGVSFDTTTGILSGVPTNSAALSSGGIYEVTVIATDSSVSENNSIETSFSIQVFNVNDLPTVNSMVDLGEIAEESPLTFSLEQLLAGAEDIDGDSLSIVNLAIASGEGELTENEDGTYTFTPSENWNGSVSLSFEIDDGNGGTVTNTANFFVTPVNDNPVAVNDGLVITDVNQPVVIDLLSNDYDVDGDTLSFVSVSASQGVITINADNTITYTPNDDFIGRDLISYSVEDGNGGVSTSLALVNVLVGNTPPVLDDDAVVTVEENIVSVGNFSATDSEDNSITYSLSGDDASLFTIDEQGNLSFISAPDYDSGQTGPYNITITATDDGYGNLQDTQNIVINISDVDDIAPSLGDDVVIDIAEGQVLVGLFNAEDLDSSEITYTLAGEDADLFSIDEFGTVSFIAPPDYETNAGPFEISVIATDPTGASDTQNIQLNVTNVVENTIPALGDDTSVSIAENETTVGTYAATDTEGDGLTYSLSGTDSSLFQIDGNGELSFITAPDYDAGETGPYEVIVTATDNGEGSLSDSQTITVSISNEIENTAPVLGADTSATVAENETTVGTYTATDSENNDITYSLSGADSGLFQIDGNGELSFVTVPDYDAGEIGPYEVIITATDNGEGGLSDSQTIIVSVSNEIENTAPVLGADTSATIAENETTVGTYAATDAEGDDLTYSLSGTDSSLFQIDGNGELSFITAPDYDAGETGPYEVVVTATDNGEGGLSDSQTVTVSVSNVIENTAPVLGADTSATIAENETTVGTYAATDAEGDDVAYSLSGADSSLFQVDSNGELSFIVAPDYDAGETGPYEVIVTATDNGEGGLSDSQTVTVSVSNVIENTAPVLGADTSATVAENSTAVGTYAGTDAEGDGLTYSLSGADSGLFQIDANGELSFITAPDYDAGETGPYEVIVTATDNGEGGLSDSQTVTVNVSNVIENIAPVLGADTSAIVVENETTVGTYAATDAEADDLTYSLSGADSALFQVDSNGELSFIVAPDYDAGETGPYEVIVTATDNGEGGLSDSQTVTINVSNVIENTAPVLGADTSATVAENSTSVGTYAATDAEADDLTYSLSGADSALFQIDSNGELSFIVAPDYDAGETGPYEVIVTATDNGEGGLSDSQTVTVSVSNIVENAAPALGADTSAIIAENETAVGTYAATDAEGDDVAYSLSGADSSLFQIDANGELSFITAPDYDAGETGPYEVIVTATDNGEGGLSDSQTVTVSVSNVIENTAPVLSADTSAIVAENETTVGTYAATDAEGDDLTYSLSGTDSSLFQIDGNGELSFITAPDYDAGETGPYEVIVTATDNSEGGLSDSQTVTVSVSNIIENTAPVLGADTSATIAENETTVGTYAATDAERDDLTYSLSGVDSGLFQIDANGELSFITAPDYDAGETGPYEVIVTATDNGEGTLSDSQTVTVSVSNVIENTAPVLGADTSATIAENETTVGTYAATDAEGDGLTYSLSGADSALFQVDANGELSFIVAPDYDAGETGPYEVIVTATDNGESGLSDSQTVTVSVSNIIENTAPVLGADTSTSVVENSTAVGTYAATDAEADDLTYSLSGADSALFQIDSNGELSFITAPDYDAGETGPYEVIVTATDNGEGGLSDSQTVTVSVSNVIENTAPILGADTSATVVENSTSVGTYAATDAEGDDLTYSLSGADSALFQIDTNGELSFITAPDYDAGETGPYEVIVTATDNGEGGLSDSQTITVSVSNIVENTAPALGADTSAIIAENETAVGTYAATDAENDDIAYSLSGADSGLFQINANGELSFITAPDYDAGETGPYEVIVTATDNGEGGLSDSQTITVNVSNVIENTAPVLGADTSAIVAENSTNVGTYTATDAEGDDLAYSLSGADSGLFQIDANGELSFITAPDYDAGETGPYEVTVTATDNGEGGLSDSQTVIVSVSNIIENTAPVLGADTSATIAENSTSVGTYAATDAEGDDITYSLSGADSGLFQIDVNGELSFITAPDYDAGETGPYEVVVTATDNGEDSLSDSQTITVNVSNVIENTAPVLGADTSAIVVENETTVGTYAATDAEGDDLAYSLSGADSALFQIDTNGELSFITAPDYDAGETGPYEVIVTATDNGEGGLSDSQTITVSVSNIVENTAPALGADTSAIIAENETAVGTYAATDAENDDIAYSLSGADSGLFQINANGELSFITAPDYDAGETGPYEVVVTATDNGEGGLSDSQTVTVNVSNVIENTAPVLGADTSATVVENEATVGTYAATDSENDDLTYSLSGVDSALFQIDGNGELSFIIAPDYDAGETGPYEVIVTATDNGEGGLSDSQTVTVNVSNVIENTAPVLGADTSVTVVESSTTVGTYAATDAESDDIAYSLSGADSGLFQINANGELSFITAPDYDAGETGPYEVIVTATDNGEGSLSDSQTVTVNVSNVIENTAPVLGADTSASIAENETTVGTYAATDAESDDITYSLSGVDSGLFQIDANGELSFIAAPDYDAGETGPYEVVVTATDNGEGSLSDSQTITVNVSNVIENTAPVLGADTSAIVAENSTNVGTYAATDAEGDDLAYSLSGADSALFQIDGNGELSFIAAPDYDAGETGPYEVVVTATDNGEGSLSDSQTITVNVSNVIENTAPVLGADTSAIVAENSTNVGTYAATDAEGDDLAYSLSGADSALFQIDGNGELSFIAAPDYDAGETGPYEVIVTATDNGEGGLSDTQTVTVNVSNVIENTAPVLGADTSATVVENSTAVGTYAATDAEADDLTYSLSGADSALFQIGSNGELSFITAPDYDAGETGPYEVIVTATDNGEGGLSDSQTVTVSVSNVIENTAPVLGADTSATVIENSTSVGTYAATDAEGDDVAYSLSGADSALFQIDGNGELSFITAPDYDAGETGPYEVIVTATDNGEGGLSDSQTVTVSVSNIIENTAPVLGADTSTSVVENSTAVGTYAATDAEADDLTYSLSGADSALFQIGSNGELSFIVAPDYDAGETGPYEVVVTATDNGEGGLSDSQTVTVSVSNVIENTAPVLGADTSATVAENETTVGTYAATDAEGDDLTYSLSGADSSLFQIDGNGELSFITAPDYDAGETGPYEVVVTATDNGEGGLSDSQTVTVSVSNVIENTAPVLGADTSATVAENETTVGTYAATDAEGDDLTYSLSGTDSSLFQIDANGELSFITAPDYDAGETGPYEVIVTATDNGEGGLSDSQTVTVSVSNVIENTAPVLGADTSAIIVENSTSVGTYAATDAEGDDLTYSLSGADSALFQIDGNGELSFITAPDYDAGETGPYEVVVTATDNGEGGLSDSQTVTINVSNVIENTAPVLGADTSAIVAENETTVGTYAATDAEGDDLTYSLSGADSTLFQIDGNGELSFITAPDYDAGETGPYEVIVTATDNGEGGLSDTQTVTVNVSNVIENTAPVLGADTSATVVENSTAVGTYAATDAEADDLTYSLSGADSALFQIGSNGELSFITAPDYDAGETGPYEVIVTATDNGEGGLSDSQTVTVSVSNVIENTAPVLGADTSATVIENSTSVGTYAATDAEGDDVAYSLSGADSALFQIDSNGELSFITAPDYDAGETGPYEVIVTATDNGEGGLSDSQTVTVSVSNVIENTAPVLGADTSATVAENETTVGTYAATDAEGDDLTYSLSGTDSGLFQINANGELSFITAPDYDAGETGPYEVIVTATDNGEGSLSDSQTVTVSVSNVIENTAPVLGADTSATVVENSTAVGTYAATDTEGDDLTYSLSGADSTLFQIDGNGELSFITAPDYDAGETGPYEVIVTATDNGEGGLSDSQTVTVSVSNVIENTAPVLGADTSATIAENETTVGTYAATDAEGDDLTYSLSGADSSLFQIDGNGELSFITAPDYDAGETGPYEVIVTATDNGEGGLSDSQTVTVSVSNIIENTAPVLGTDTTININENSTAVIGNYAATDAENDNITYTLSGDDSALFEIDTAGNLRFTSGQDFESPADVGADGIYNVTITATDDGEGNLSDLQNISVTVDNEDEAPEVSVINSTITEVVEVEPVEFVGDPFPNTPGDGPEDANGVDPSNLNLTSTVNINVEFRAESAGFHNVIGWYTIDADGNISGVDILWEDTEDPTIIGSNILLENVSAENIGFFLVQDAYAGWRHQDDIDDFLAGTGVFRFENADGNPAVVGDVGVTLVYYSAGDENNPSGSRTELQNTFHTHDASLNPGGLSRVSSGIDGADSSTLVIGFEDLTEGPYTVIDWDLLDAVIAVSIDEVTRYSEINSSLTIVDDSQNLISAEVIIGEGRTGDYLFAESTTESLAASYGITLTYDETTKVLELNGLATISEYQEILSAVRLGNDEGLGNDPREIRYSVTDEGSTSSDLTTVMLDSDPSYDYVQNDFIAGGEGNDLLIGGAGEDILLGNAGSDTFAWNAGDEGTIATTDTILDFTQGIGGDILDLADILTGESLDAATLDAYLDVSSDGSDTTISIDVDGDGSGANMDIVLAGVDLTLLGANDQQIIQQLIDDGNIQTSL